MRLMNDIERLDEVVDGYVGVYNRPNMYYPHTRIVKLYDHFIFVMTDKKCYYICNRDVSYTVKVTSLDEYDLSYDFSVVESIEDVIDMIEDHEGEL
jgi:hypothetical protein